jgi:hypothetical protein
MKRATITIPDELERDLERYLAAQDPPPTLAALVQSALRRYLAEEQLRLRDYRPPRGPLRIRPAGKGSRRQDVAERHDRYLAEPSDE